MSVDDNQFPTFVPESKFNIIGSPIMVEGVGVGDDQFPTFVPESKLSLRM